MTLASGSRLGPYEIVAPLGAGGMGEVYRATDARLRRQVALKVIPSALARDADRLARFRREAQVLASLNHPNIAAIYGLEEGDGVPFLVLELVEGEDLAQRLARGPMAIEEALAISRQIAEALEEAHEKGIVHRDLKPANVKLTPDGKVKVLDFGLAKAYESDAAGGAGIDGTRSPTMTHAATVAGMILGTAAYMSPEQARGRTVDRRADIWAFGVLLYEMLTGRRAFEGEDISITLANVLKEDVDWQALPPDLPPSVRRLLRRCLEKDPRRRLSAIGDARLDLDEKEPAAAPVAVPSSPRRSIGLPLAATIAAAAILGTVIGMRVFSPPSAPAHGGVIHLTIALPPGEQLVGTALMPLALSPDGSALAYVSRGDGAQRICLRRLSEREPAELAGTEGAFSPFFSPDGQWIGFFADGKVKKISVSGAGLQVIFDDTPDPRGGDWGADGNIYFAPVSTSGIWKVPATGGAAAEVTRKDTAQGEISHRWPRFLPEHQALLYNIWTGPGLDERAIVFQSLATGERRTLLRGANTPRYLDSGFLMYARMDDLLAVPWGPETKDLAGVVPLTLPEHPREVGESAAMYAVSRNGTLVYVPGGARWYAQRVLWVDRSGRTEVLPLPERDYESVAISPDGSRAVLQTTEGTVHLWIYDFSRRTLLPFLTAGSSQAPVWTLDGQRIIYRATRKGRRNLCWKAADGTGEEEWLTEKEGILQTPTSVTSDGRWAIFSEMGLRGSTSTTLWALPLTGERTPRPVVQAPGRVADGQVSPDGKWLAFNWNGSGRLEVYVQPFPGPGPRVQVSNGGGSEPRWSRDGREIFYLNLSYDKLMAAAVRPGAAFSTGEPRVLMEGRYRPSGNVNTAYDVSADGRRFLRIQQVEPQGPMNQLDVVLNWAEELKRIAANR
ncbi:MAG TPA: protein kinase [Candidatus Polarisedimenticolia bacterium]|jgi:serine/threonine-protein kinase|nr:protein kinase [Candidatus Polarisedimenticolia bacterium]